jgi:pimeloyl-ACP methyl ester carboxylesterase
MGSACASASATRGGQPVVLQHGLCADGAQTAEMFLDDPHWRWLTLECRGHGRSDAGDRAGFSIAAFADDLAALIEARGLAPVVAGGISMGAAIALRLAVRRPELVRGLVLARPAWVTDSGPANMAPNAAVGRLLARHDSAEAREIFARSATAHRLARDAPDNLASLMGFFAREPQDVTAALLTAISRDGPDVTVEEVHALDVPTLVIGHGRDVVHPFAHAEALAGLIPGARLIAIAPKAADRARHVAEFRTALRTFLEDLT